MSEFIFFCKENILIIADINDNIIVYDIVNKKLIVESLIIFI